MNSTPRPQRKTNPDIAERRKARAWLGPYVRCFPAWHEKAGLISARMLVRATTGNDRAELEQEVFALVDDIEAQYRDFQDAQQEHPANSHVSDVEHAFVRILEIVRRLGFRQPV